MGFIGIEENASETGRISVFDQRFEYFPRSEHIKLRAMVPIVKDNACTYVNASSQPPMNSKVREALDNFLDEWEYKSHPKPDWQAVTKEAKMKLAKYLHVQPDSLAFTRDTTEGLNLFQRSILIKPGDNVVVLDVEHPNHVYGRLALVETAGLEVRIVPTGKDRFADANTFAPYVDEHKVAIGLSSIMFHSGQLEMYYCFA